MIINTKLPAIILAGGESKRFGRDKKNYLFQGKSLLQHTVDSLGNRKVYISGKETLPGIHNAEYIPDRYPECTPLNGMVSFLEQVNESVLITCCDMPFVPSAVYCFLEEKLQSAHGLFLRDPQGRVVPFPGIYTPECLDVLKMSLENCQYRLSRVLADLRTILNITMIDPQELLPFDRERMSFININRLEDLKVLKRFWVDGQ